ncbi:HPr family phosphocarrier protein [Cetobacterium sp.]|uniref:HPr family phosphocarrier protein n=1 Tax=Cetobacterium sp. TaxID=2071632 RepID=UPI003AF05258
MELELVVNNKNGLHSRPATKIVQLALKYDSTIKIFYGEKEANLSLLKLGATKGTKLKFILEGKDADKAIWEFNKLFKDNFGEDNEGDIEPEIFYKKSEE